MKTLSGRRVRPTADRVREALFSILGDTAAGSRVLDLFAGTGALGLEALSRGAEKVIFVERSGPVLEIIKANIAGLAVEEESEIITDDYRTALKRLGERGDRFDLILADPPYESSGEKGKTIGENILSLIGKFDMLREDGLVVIEHFYRTKPVLPDLSWQEIQAKKYGQTGLTFLYRDMNSDRKNGKRAIYAGSFDPITLGHLDLIQRSARVFPQLTIAVADNMEKKPFFPLSQRLSLIRESITSLPEVEVESFSGLLIDFAARKGARILIRGLRVVSDFEYEFQMALTNRKLSPELEIIFLMPSEACSYISSRMVKEIFLLGGDISAFVPTPVVKAFKSG